MKENKTICVFSSFLFYSVRIYMIIAIVSFIILLMVLVLVHEFGHFILARKAGVTVHEFSIGMGPKVLSFGKDKKGTHFVLRLFPIG